MENKDNMSQTNSGSDLGNEFKVESELEKDLEIGTKESDNVTGGRVPF